MKFPRSLQRSKQISASCAALIVAANCLSCGGNRLTSTALPPLTAPATAAVTPPNNLRAASPRPQQQGHFLYDGSDVSPNIYVYGIDPASGGLSLTSTTRNPVGAETGGLLA